MEYKKVLLFGFVLILLSSFVSATLLSDNEIYYKMEEAASPLVDSNPNNIGATCANCPAFQQAGILDFAVHFDGVDDEFRIDANTEIDSGTNKFTINFWAKTDNNGVLQNFYGYETPITISPCTAMQYHGNTDNSLTWSVIYVNAGNNLNVNTAANAVTDTNWHMYTFMRTGDFTAEIWVDGVNKTNAVPNAGVAQSIIQDRQYIGSIGSGANEFNGRIDEWSFYSTDLTLAQIIDLYNLGAPGSDQQYPFRLLLFELTASNEFNGSNIPTFDAEISNSTFALNITTLNGTIYWPQNQIINITIWNSSGNTYFNRTYLNINSSVNLVAELHQSILNIYTVNLDNTTEFVDITYNINNTDESINKSLFSGVSPTIVNATSGNYFILAEKIGFPEANTTFSVLPLQNKTVYITMGIIATINLIDESTLGPFNVSRTNSTKVTVVCADIGSLEFPINESTFNITISCQYTKLRFTIQYDDITYTRNVLSSKVSEFEQDIYLIDLTTTQSIFNSFVINDYAGEYKDIQLYVKKNVAGAQVVIHSDDIDIENKMSVFLIENDEYILEMLSSNNPDIVLGFYGADISGNKEITVTTANAALVEPDILGDGITIITYSKNGSLIAHSIYQNQNLDTDSVTWALEILNTTNNSRQEVYTVTTISDDVTFASQNITEYVNFTVYSIITYTIDGDTESFTKIINVQPEILSDGTMFFWFTAAALQWAVIIFLSVFQLLGTISSQNYVNYITIGLAGVFIIFGLINISIVVLVLGLLINFLDHLKKAEAQKVI